MISHRSTTAGKKVFVGLSGGVDSSVSAALLKKAGYDVTGVFIKVWHPDFLPCNWREDRLDAMRVCAKLEIPFLTFDFEKEYKAEVVDYMIREYREGRTPNPDVMCNKNVKFGAFLKKAREMGADFVATGHYAQNIRNPKTGLFEMKESADTEKDQTYFLWTLSQDQLAHILFPVGGLKKPEVRKLAKKFGLPTAEKKDSQGLCFIGKVDMKDFLSHYMPKKQGKVLDEQGNVIGTHDGAYFYTVGQRHGFIITEKGESDDPVYVSEKDIAGNTITVSKKNPDDTASGSSLLASELFITSANWTLGKPPTTEEVLEARIRYRQPLDICRIQHVDEILTRFSNTSHQDALKLTFEKPQTAVSSGQSVVIYRDGVCLGGGVIV